MRLPAIGATVLAFTLGGPLWSAIAGLPVPPRPGPMPGKWLTWANDAYGGEVGDNPDDFRTNAFAFGITIEQDWLLSADLSSLTDKANDDPRPGSRSDELTVTIGRVLTSHVDRSLQAFAATGIGLRYAGNLGGERMQNEWHEVIDFVPIVLPYDDSAYQGIGWLSTQLLWLSDTRAPFGDCVFCDGSRIGFNLELASLAGTEGELQADISAAFVWTGHDSAIWAGLRQRASGSKALTPTAEIIAEAEDGTWFQYGVSVGAWAFQGGVHLADSTSFGSLSWMFDRVPIHNRLGDDIFHTELGLTLNSYGLMGQARWKPRWLSRSSPLGDRAMLLLEYRFGRVPETKDINAVSVRYQQGIVGFDVSAFAPKDGVQLNPFLYGGLGWRFEDIRHEGPSPALPEADENGFVIQGGAGLRLTWGDRPRQGRGIQYGVTTTYDVYQPFDRAEVQRLDDPGASYTLLDANHTVSLRLAIAVGW